MEVKINNGNNATMHVPIEAKTLRILFVFALNSLKNRKYNPTPIIPPNVFPIRSVISLTPIAKMNYLRFFILFSSFL
ncbi:hypothetical protein [Metaclostridioides mangenotii]|uniref:hypothetical protein n=1 Tax=Metaclostridioides mangenotii TaxID=1540 RepID=UPI001AE164A0|nr:hypothetical protein [Clostridioides mangenotii]